MRTNLAKLHHEHLQLLVLLVLFARYQSLCHDLLSLRPNICVCRRLHNLIAGLFLLQFVLCLALRVSEKLLQKRVVGLCQQARVPETLHRRQRHI